MLLWKWCACSSLKARRIRARNLGRALVKRGHTSIIVSSADKEHELVKRLERDGNIYHQLSLEKILMALRQIWPLRQLIEKYQPDIIHLHSRTPAWILHWALKGAKLKHKPKLVPPCMGSTLNNYSRALLNVDCTITVSDSVSEYLLQGIKEVKKTATLNHSYLSWRRYS